MRITFSDIKFSVSTIADYLVRDRTISYDYVVGISYGGIYPAAYLSTILGIPMISIDAKSYDPNTKSRGDLIITDTCHIGPIIDGKNIILCDDIFDSGATILGVSKYLREFNVKKVQRYCVITKNSILCDYKSILYSYDLSDDINWVEFPWE